MDESEARQRAIDALLAKFVSELELQRVDRLAGPVYGFDPVGWHLFFFWYGRRGSGAGEYIAVKRETGDVRFLGPVGQ